MVKLAIVTGVVALAITTAATALTVTQVPVAGRLEVAAPQVQPTLQVRDSDSNTWNGEHDALQPAVGYRAVQASEVPLQRTVQGQ